MARRSTRQHVMGVLFCTEHQIPFEDEPDCWCGVLHPPTLRECEEACPLWRGEPTTLPEATKVPCNECPWRRNSWAGHLGPFAPAVWLALVHGEDAIACHKTIEEEDDWTTPGIRQCAGAARYRANVFKSPRDPAVAVGPRDPEVFARPAEFTAHHTGAAR